MKPLFSCCSTEDVVKTLLELSPGSKRGVSVPCATLILSPRPVVLMGIFSVLYFGCAFVNHLNMFAMVRDICWWMTPLRCRKRRTYYEGGRTHCEATCNRMGQIQTVCNAMVLRRWFVPMAFSAAHRLSPPLPGKAMRRQYCKMTTRPCVPRYFLGPLKSG